MKKVVSSAQVAHLWAHQAQSEARNGSGSLYFVDNVIYSYGSHFPIARILDGCVLLSNRGYSVTTSQHRSIVAHACAHLPNLFYVDNVRAASEREHRENFADYAARYELAGLNAARARTRIDWYISEMENIEQEANKYAELFGLPDRIVPADMEALKERAKEQAKVKRAQTAARAQAQSERFADELAQYIESVKAWRQHAGNVFRMSWSNPHHSGCGALLRVSSDGKTVETSQGAQFPVADVAAAWRIVSRCVQQNQAFESYDLVIRLGPFRLDRVSSNGDVTAGCHFVKYAECRLLAESLGLLKGA